MTKTVQNAFTGRIFDFDWAAAHKPNTVSLKRQREGLGRVPSRMDNCEEQLPQSVITQKLKRSEPFRSSFCQKD